MIERGEFATNVGRAQAAIKSNPDSAAGWVLLGSVHLLNERAGDAADALERAAAIDPDAASTWSKLGLARLQSSRVDTDVAFERALALDSANMLANEWYGISLAGRGENARAFTHLARLEGNAETSIQAIMELARLLALRERHEDAIKMLEPRVPLDSTLTRGHMILAASMLEANRNPDAVTRFNRAHELGASPRFTQLGIAIALRDSGDAKGSKAAFARL